jgi:hypothetical protein
MPTPRQFYPLLSKYFLSFLLTISKTDHNLIKLELLIILLTNWHRKHNIINHYLNSVVSSHRNTMKKKVSWMNNKTVLENIFFLFWFIYRQNLWRTELEDCNFQHKRWMALAHWSKANQLFWDVQDNARYRKLPPIIAKYRTLFAIVFPYCMR